MQSVKTASFEEDGDQIHVGVTAPNEFLSDGKVDSEPEGDVYDSKRSQQTETDSQSLNPRMMIQKKRWIKIDKKGANQTMLCLSQIMIPNMRVENDAGLGKGN